MNLLTIGCGLVLILIAYGWFTGMRAKQIAVAASAKACQVRGWQFLDDTATLTKLRFHRSASGGLRLKRRFAFEYDDGDLRRKSSYVVLIGYRVIDVGLPKKDNVVSFSAFRQQQSHSDIEQH